MLNFIIQKEEADQTLISFLKRRLKSTPLNLIYKLFRTKKVTVAGENIRYYHYRLKIGEKVLISDPSLKISQPKIVLPVKTEINWEITYEDENILIASKEHNIEIHSNKNNDCLNNAVRYHLYQKNPSQYHELSQKYFIINALHRLDKLTKGLVIYPKNPTAKKLLYNAINNKEKITKKYLAVCENRPKKELPACITGFL